MKSMNRTFIAIFVMGVVLAGTTSLAEVANTVWDDQQITNIVNDHQDQIAQNKADSINRDIATDNRLTQVNDDLQSTKPGVLVVDKMANDAHQKALLAGALADTARLKSETALQGVATNGTDGEKGDKGDAGATYNSESALAVGASVNFNSHVIAKVSFSDDTANNMGASVGIGMGF
ncbi:YadA C-terminal domain-containing protein [Enterobacter hormaechei]